MKWFWKLIPHDCDFVYTDAHGDKNAKFFMVRICRKCGLAQKKDLRIGGPWKNGKYIPQHNKPELEIVSTHNKNYKRRGW